jgi:hypothetical protein
MERVWGVGRIMLVQCFTWAELCTRAPCRPWQLRIAVNWLAELGATKWIDHISSILSSANQIVAHVESGQSVLVHWYGFCSTGQSCKEP